MSDVKRYLAVPVGEAYYLFDAATYSGGGEVSAYVLASDHDALAARLADESREHADTLCHNAEMGAALVDCRARLAEAELLAERRADQLVQEREDAASDVRKLSELAQWMTGCGYDFTQHQYFRDHQHLLSGSGNADPTPDSAVDGIELDHAPLCRYLTSGGPCNCGATSTVTVKHE